ncbi:hypothetical protein [Natrinema halophilum]|nr:hypothetical protein [Natrinema halophilum]QLG49097.2 hypothetical protein HYG82_09660 [Natrinema halophilum]
MVGGLLGGTAGGGGLGTGLAALGIGAGAGIGAVGIGKGLGEALGGTGDFAEGVGEGLGGTLEGTGDFAQGVGEGLGDVLSGLGDLGPDSVEVNPEVDFSPTLKPEFNPRFDVSPEISPEINIGAEHEVSGTVPVEEPTEPYPVEDVEPLEVEDIDPIEITVSVNGPAPAGVTEGSSVSTTGNSFSETADDEFGDPFGRASQLGSAVPAAGHGAGFAIGAIESTTSYDSAAEMEADRLDPNHYKTTPTDTGSIPLSETGIDPSTFDTDTASGTSASTVSVTTDPQITLENSFETEIVVDELRQFRQKTLTEIEKMVNDAFDELEDELENVKDDVDSLERAFNGR